MPKINVEDVLDKDELEDYDNKDNIFYWENFCCACDHFENPDECKFFGKVFKNTKWKEIKCDDFWD